MKNRTTSGASIAASSSILCEYSSSFAFETLNQQEQTINKSSDVAVITQVMTKITDVKITTLDQQISIFIILNKRIKKMLECLVNPKHAIY